MTTPSLPDRDEAVSNAARDLLLTRYRAAQFDATRRVSTAGFLCSPGAPGSGKVRVCHRTRFPSVLNGLTFADAAAEEYVLVSAYADLLRANGWSVRERQGRSALLVSTPACPECSGPPLPLSVEAGSIWGCPCGRRTCGTGDENDDFDLPSYTETGPDGAVVAYHGHGEEDIEGPPNGPRRTARTTTRTRTRTPGAGSRTVRPTATSAATGGSCDRALRTDGPEHARSPRIRTRAR
ncbi:hypothetical protein [Kitasatospora sp. NBC_01300]|uniref:hypothetical protein n=1 Tax=Kitasatospora sp. NBC_01300 TaxID=2903574 RepID=UPI002F90C05F|nr:hypothetical protein OG556_40150 [Kitasatospora sp. NBC_01300]